MFEGAHEFVRLRREDTAAWGQKASRGLVVSPSEHNAVVATVAALSDFFAAPEKLLPSGGRPPKYPTVPSPERTASGRPRRVPLYGSFAPDPARVLLRIVIAGDAADARVAWREVWRDACAGFLMQLALCEPAGRSRAGHDGDTSGGGQLVAVAGDAVPAAVSSSADFAEVVECAAALRDGPSLLAGAMMFADDERERFAGRAARPRAKGREAEINAVAVAYSDAVREQLRAREVRNAVVGAARGGWAKVVEFVSSRRSA